MYGIQTLMQEMYKVTKFENDVKMYGIQTRQDSLFPQYRLRMM